MYANDGPNAGFRLVNANADVGLVGSAELLELSTLVPK